MRFQYTYLFSQASKAKEKMHQMAYKYLGHLVILLGALLVVWFLFVMIWPIMQFVGVIILLSGICYLGTQRQSRNDQPDCECPTF